MFDKPIVLTIYVDIQGREDQRTCGSEGAPQTQEEGHSQGGGKTRLDVQKKKLFLFDSLKFYAIQIQKKGK